MIQKQKLKGGIHFVGAVSFKNIIKIAANPEKVSDFFRRMKISESLVWFECTIGQEVSRGSENIKFRLTECGFILTENHISEIKNAILNYVAFELNFRGLREYIKRSLKCLFPCANGQFREVEDVIDLIEAEEALKRDDFVPLEGLTQLP
jgi:hypothetical protein